MRKFGCVVETTTAPPQLYQIAETIGAIVKKKPVSRTDEKSFVLFAPDESDVKILAKLCKKYKKTEEEVLSAAFRVGFPLLDFLGKNPSEKT